MHLRGGNAASNALLSLLAFITRRVALLSLLRLHYCGQQLEGNAREMRRVTEPQQGVKLGAAARISLGAHLCPFPQHLPMKPLLSG